MGGGILATDLELKMSNKDVNESRLLKRRFSGGRNLSCSNHHFITLTWTKTPTADGEILHISQRGSV